jgi:hypothetical protein
MLPYDFGIFPDRRPAAIRLSHAVAGIEGDLEAIEKICKGVADRIYFASNIL